MNRHHTSSSGLRTVMILAGLAALALWFGMDWLTQQVGL